MTYWRRCKAWCQLEDSHIAPIECSTELKSKNQKMKSPQQIEIKAGIILGRLQKDGFSPNESAEVAILLSAYLIERFSKNPAVALEATIRVLRANVQLPS